jgi:hypothetical protein
MLGDADQPRRRIHSTRIAAEMFADAIARQCFDLGIPGVIVERFDLSLVEPFRDQLAFDLGDPFMEAIIAIGNAARAALDAEFFRRHATSVETARERPSCAGMSLRISPRQLSIAPARSSINSAAEIAASASPFSDASMALRSSGDILGMFNP